MDILKPSLAESLTLGAITIILLIIGGYEQFADWFFLVPEVQDQVETAISVRFDTFLGLIDEFEFTASIVSGVIWSVIGAFVFMVVWALINVGSDLKNSLKVSTVFVHPRSFHQSTFWAAFIIRTLFKSSLVIMLVAGAVLWVTAFIPAVFTALQLILADTQVPARIIGVFGAGVVTFLSMHLFVVLLRMLLGRSRIRGEAE